MNVQTGKLGRIEVAHGWVNTKPYGYIWSCYMCTDTLGLLQRWATILMASKDLENHHRMRH